MNLPCYGGGHELAIRQPGSGCSTVPDDIAGATTVNHSLLGTGFLSPGALAADIVRYRYLFTAESRFMPDRFPLEVASLEPRLLRVKSVIRICPDWSPDIVVVPEPRSRGTLRHVRSSRSWPE